MPTSEILRTDLPQLVTPLPGPRARSIIERDGNVLSPSYTRCYPLVADRGEGAIVEDVDGNRFLDFNAGIAVVSTGHCHPKVVGAMQRQSERLIHMSGTDFYYENMVDLAEKLAASAPGDGPRRVYFGNSGAEAIEASLKLARHFTGRDKIIAFQGCFHGRTMGALSLTSSKAIQRKGFGPFVPGVFHAPFPDPYRSGLAPEACAEASIHFIEELFRTTLPPDEVAAIFVEPIQGEGGYVVPPRAFFTRLQELAARHKVLLVADEIQCGMGRTGKLWASEHFGFVPDIIASAKGIASGMPLSAVIARADVMAWRPGAHASTFGGNPVAIAAALATFELIEREYMSNAARMGEFIFGETSDWTERHKIVGDVRGRGLMIGVEIVRDQKTKQPAPELRKKILEAAFHKGLLILGAGESTLRLAPPLLIDEEQAAFAVRTLDECIGKVERDA